MRIIFRLFICILVFSLSAFAQQSSWQQVCPTPQGNALNAMQVFTQDSVIAVGASGTFMRTSNGGTTWDIDPLVNGIQEQFLGVSFPSRTIGYICGENGIMLKTTDAGLHWNQLEVKTFADLFSVSFVSTTTGWACGAGGTIVHTTNGGTTWIEDASGVSGSLFAIQFVTASTGWAVGVENRAGIIVKTTNAGASWFAQPVSANRPLYSICFGSSSIGWVVGSFGLVFKTTNGGSVWSQQVNDFGLDMQSIFVHPSSTNTAWACGSYGTIGKTTDGGQNWVLQTVDTYRDLFCIRFANSTVGWAIGDGGIILKTTNGGTTWVNQSSVCRTDLYNMFWPSTSVGYCVGEEGTVLRTSDGGTTWQNRDVGYYWPFYGVMFLNEDLGWVVGDSGLIMRTNTGGNSWVKQPSLSEDVFTGVYFSNGSKGFVWGDYGQILRTTNAGGSWIAETTDNDSYNAILDLKMYGTTNTGWAVGDFGMVLKTTDGGIHWFTQKTGIGESLYSLEILDQNTVYICGDFGTILKTTNGGTTWQVTSLDYFETFYDITFYGNDKAWVLGDYGLIVGTTNGGITWKEQLSGTSNETFFSIQAIPATTGAVVYAGGTSPTVLASVISPLPVKVWTGNTDSLWSNQTNWSPSGVPKTYDSVYVPVTAKRLAIRSTYQRISVGALNIAPGGRVFIGTGVSQLFISGNTNVAGTLEIDPSARTDIFSGGNFIVDGSMSGGNSNLTFNSKGAIKGSFANVIVNDGSSLNTAGKVTVNGTLKLYSNIGVRPEDTVVITSTDPQTITGFGLMEGGTIKRAINSTPNSLYRFGSPVTTVSFYSGGTFPTNVLITSNPGVKPPEYPDSIFVKRNYIVSTQGGSNFKGGLALRIGEDETNLFVDQIGMFRDSNNYLVNLGVTDYIDEDYIGVLLDSLKKFDGTYYLGDYKFQPRLPLEFYGAITVQDNGSGLATLNYGAAPNATNGLDSAFSETQLGPKPGSGTFDARWKISTNVYSMNDYRPMLTSTGNENVYTCEFQPGGSGYPFTIQWNFQNLPAGSMFIRDGNTQGTKFNVNMRNQSLLTITDQSVTSFQIVQKYPLFIDVRKDWNLLSLPVTPISSNKKAYYFSYALSPAFGFDYTSGYKISDSLQNGKGYWLKYFRDGKIPLEGSLRLVDTFSVAATHTLGDWNMIGSISTPIATSRVTTIPASNLLAGFYFSYNNGYSIADTIKPGQGYWIKIKPGGGKLVLSSGSEMPPGSFPKTNIESFHAIKITDQDGGNQNLFIGKESDITAPLDWYEMPPSPPEGIFDARFQSQRSLEILKEQGKTNMMIQVQSNHYPVTVSFDSKSKEVSFIKVSDAVHGTKLGTIAADGKSIVKINNPAINKIKLEIVGNVDIPKIYSLEQNYPNPFNPTTTIQFSIPEQSKISIEVFNILGQQVAKLADNVSYEPGNHLLTMNASDLASGMYFYRLIAHKENNSEIVFQQVKKMMILK